MTVIGHGYDDNVGAPAYRNLIYNGAMQVAQRGTSTASITTTGYYTADRWQVVNAGLGTWTQSVAADAPTAQGFRNSLKMLCTTADASPAAGDVMTVQQTLEGYDVQRILKGTASAQTLKLSFWVKSNKTGTYIVECADYDNSRSTSQSYTVDAVDTWEQKTITIPADTTGTLNNDNGASLGINFWLGAGTNYTSGTLATSWGAQVAANRAVGQTNLAAATNNYWQITGVQLEVGPIATPFEFEPYETTLIKCERYFQKTYNDSTNPGTNTTVGAYAFSGTTQSTGLVLMPVLLSPRMRSAPQVAFYQADGTAGTWNYARSGATGTTTMLADLIGTKYFRARTGNLGAGYVPAETFGHWTASAEL